MQQIRLAVLIGLTLAAAASRLLPHPPNFTPIGAIALFGGACFAGRRARFLVPLAAMLCLVAAIPYFHNTILGDLVDTAALFGGLALAERGFPAVREIDPERFARA